MKPYPYPYKVVPTRTRFYVHSNRKKNHQVITDPLVLDLLAGKTLLVDCNVSLDKGGPFGNLYNYFNSRGYNFEAHLYDDVDKGIFRGMLLWATKVTDFERQDSDPFVIRRRLEYYVKGVRKKVA